MHVGTGYSRNGVIVIMQGLTQGCFMLAMVCPLGAIRPHPTRPVAVTCDRCPDRGKRGQEGVDADVGGPESKRSVSPL